MTFPPWSAEGDTEEDGGDYGFCHGEFSQSECYCPEALHIAASTDWVYGGFFPKCVEALLFCIVEESGTNIGILVNLGE